MTVSKGFAVAALRYQGDDFSWQFRGSSDCASFFPYEKWMGKWRVNHRDVLELLQTNIYQ